MDALPSGNPDLAAVAAGAASDAGGLDPELLGDFLPTAVDAAATGRRLRPAELEGYAAQGAAAAQAGVALRALIDLYLSASWRLWRDLPMVATGSAAQVRAAGLAVLRAADDGVAALAEGFQQARNDLSRRQESARREVFDGLLAGGAEAAAVLEQAAGLGLDLAAPHAVLVASGSFEGDRAAPLLGRLERALQGRHGDAGVLLAVKGGKLVCIFAAPDDRAVTQVRDRVVAVLDVAPARGRGGGRSAGRSPARTASAAPTSRPGTPWSWPSASACPVRSSTPAPWPSTGCCCATARRSTTWSAPGWGRCGRPAAAPGRC